MATKFLRKIILEELQKVLSEQVYDTDIFGGQGPIDPSQAPLGSPLNPRESTPYLDPQYVRSKPKPKVKSKAQLRREAVRRMQKELERLGYPGGLQKPGVFDDVTLDYLQTTFPGIDKTRTPDSISTDTINTFVSFLKKKPTGYAGVARPIEPDVPNTGIDPKMKGSFTPEEEQKIMDYYKTLPGPKESITREINKLLKML